ncbi:MAG: EAL domain-containing protein [Anaerolineaceae bacterium]|nr:EAL domain-containing protein [Anaerolineaceae bacterium]
MRVAFSLIFISLIAALGICRFFACRSHKSIAPAVAMLLGALIPPVSGNLLIIAYTNQHVATLGYYIYFLGMNYVMFALLRFTFDYCLIKWRGNKLKNLVYGLMLIDTIQYALNPFFKQAFETKEIIVDSAPYFSLLAHWGQTFHRIVDYGIFFAVLLIFIVKVIDSPRIYSERYSTLLIAMIVIGLWETFYIFSNNPIDRSMIGFGVFGLLVYYFALHYRPMRLLDRMLANIVSDMSDALFFFDAVGRCIWVNSRGIELLDIENEDFEHVTDRLCQRFDLNGLMNLDNTFHVKRTVHGDDGDRYYVIEKRSTSDDRGHLAGTYITVRDNTEEQRAFEKEKFIAHHDELTGLYTREYLYKRIRDRLLANQNGDYCVVFVDANNFKVINDIYGNEFGDYALKVLGNWVRNNFPESSIYGRISGDMFGICLPFKDFHPEKYETELENFSIKDGKLEHPLLVHLGVYRITEPGLDVSVMFDRARMALNTIKDEFSKHVAFYDDNMRDRVLWDQMISSQLHEALQRGEVRPYLQPVVDANGVVVGAEALVRWIHPIDGLLSPASFIPVFERNGMIAEIDKHMWRCACEILARWKKEGRDLFISVNISPKDFYFMDVAEEIKSIVKEYGVDPSKMRVEITESAMMEDIENRVKVLNDLEKHGFLVEMDDFGAGYSSLNMLKDMPVEVIKLDMVFLKETNNDTKAKKILNHIVKLSDDLGVTSLTEGVETRDQYSMLVDMGCKLFQGYYFAKPMPVEEFEIFCEKRS